MLIEYNSLLQWNLQINSLTLKAMLLYLKDSLRIKVKKRQGTWSFSCPDQTMASSFQILPKTSKVVLTSFSTMKTWKRRTCLGNFWRRPATDLQWGSDLNWSTTKASTTRVRKLLTLNWSRLSHSKSTLSWKNSLRHSWIWRRTHLNTDELINDILSSHYFTFKGEITFTNFRLLIFKVDSLMLYCCRHLWLNLASIANKCLVSCRLWSFVQ